MANPRLNSLDEYEQLKRKNRRRLVGASAMVVLAGILLAKCSTKARVKKPRPRPARRKWLPLRLKRRKSW